MLRENPLRPLIVVAVSLIVAAAVAAAVPALPPSDSLALALATCDDPILGARNGLCVCPVNCRCYTWSKLRRVDCVRKRLANINSNDVPIKVQVLDISDNLIADLTEGYFWGLSHVEWLLIARNALHDLDPLSLSGLRRLAVLDLSDNRLRMLPSRLFAETPRLKELRLAGNRLVSVAPHDHMPFPIVEARHLQELDVSRCQLAYLSPTAFLAVPRLISLNVSNNQFLQLPISAFLPLTALRNLYADGNPFNCDPEMERFTSTLNLANVTVSGLCKARPSTPTSSSASSGPLVVMERMMAAPPGSVGQTDDQDYPFEEWEMEEPIMAMAPPLPPARPANPPDTRDICEAITKPEPFFKFDFSNLFSVVIGFKVGFVTALLLLRGCNGRSRPLEISEVGNSSNSRLLQRSGSGTRAGNVDVISDPTDAGRQCDTTEVAVRLRPETPPPSYHELRFSNPETTVR